LRVAAQSHFTNLYMFITDDEISSRLKQDENLALRVPETPRRQITDLREREEIRHEDSDDDNTTIVPLHNGGRRPGDKNIPESLRSVIGAVARLDTLENTADAFGISKHHAFELKHGMNSTAQGQDETLVKDINDKLAKPHQLAVDKLVEALTAVDIGRVNKAKPKEVAQVAGILANIAEKTSPIKRDEEDKFGMQLIVYAPSIKQENKYDSVHVARTN
jgi:hypothetical protein